jgi:hypothetical protein
VRHTAPRNRTVRTGVRLGDNEAEAVVYYDVLGDTAGGQAAQFGAMKRPYWAVLALLLNFVELAWRKGLLHRLPALLAPRAVATPQGGTGSPDSGSQVAEVAGEEPPAGQDAA